MLAYCLKKKSFYLEKKSIRKKKTENPGINFKAKGATENG